MGNSLSFAIYTCLPHFASYVAPVHAVVNHSSIALYSLALLLLCLSGYPSTQISAHNLLIFSIGSISDRVCIPSKPATTR